MASVFSQQMGQIEGCTRCALSNIRSQIVTYRGNPAGSIMVVGEAPGREEDRLGLPMVGPTGSYLVNILYANGLTDDDLYVTNVVLCRPLDNADPKADQMDACSDWLNLQIQLVKPRVILAVGRIAASRLIPEFSMTGSRITSVAGQHYAPPHLRGIVVIPIVHPSAILRSPSTKPDYETMLAKVVQDIRTLLAEPPIGITYPEEEPHYAF